MQHLWRLGGVLVLAMVGFMAFRTAPEQVTLGILQPKHSPNPQAWAARPVQIEPATECANCHSDITTPFKQSSHRTFNCANCHGVTIEHVENKAPMPKIEGNAELCGLCHAKVFNRPSGFPQINLEEHGEGKTCTTCHNPHSPRTMGPHQPPKSWEEMNTCLTCHQVDTCALCHGQMFEAVKPVPEGAPPNIPHNIENRSDCLNCHGPWGMRPAPASHANRTNDMCLKCHSVGVGAGSKSPPVIAHPLQGRDDCLSCHAPGTLLPFPDSHKGRTNDMCLLCHKGGST